MYFLTDNIEGVTEEWFKMFEWMLVISALSFVSKQTSEIFFTIACYSSIALLFIRNALTYPPAIGRTFNLYPFKKTQSENDEAQFSIKHIVPAAIGMAIASGVATTVAGLAFVFATELVDIVN